MVPYNQRLQSYVSKSIDKLFRTIQFRQGVRRVIGTVSLENLSNVSGATPTDGEVLEWSQTQGLWIPGAGGGGGTIPNLQSVMNQGSTYLGTNDFTYSRTGGSWPTVVEIKDDRFQARQTNSGDVAEVHIKSGKAQMFTQNGSLTNSVAANSSSVMFKFADSGTGESGLEFDAGSMRVKDTHASTGLIYSADYSGNFTARSIIDKAYVDTEISSIGTPTLQQVMDQGAAYSGTNNFSMESAKSSIIDQGFNLAIGHSNGTGDESLTTMAGSSLWNLSSGSSGTAELVLDADASVKLNWKDGVTKSELLIDGTQMLVTDANNTKGLEYAGAYKSFFTLHSLVDKDYVDTEIAGIPAGPTIGGDNTIPYSNAAGTDFDYTSDLLFDGTEMSLGQGTFSTGSVLNVNNSTASRDTVIRSYDGTTTSSYGMQITNNGAASSGFKGGILANITNSGTTSTGSYGAVIKARDSITAFANGSPTYVGGHFVASMSTHDAYGLYVDSRQSNTGDNTGLYVNAANAGTGAAYGIYQDGGSAYNIFKGRTYLGNAPSTPFSSYLTVDSDGATGFATTSQFSQNTTASEAFTYAISANNSSTGTTGSAYAIQGYATPSTTTPNYTAGVYARTSSVSKVAGDHGSYGLIAELGSSYNTTNQAAIWAHSDLGSGEVRGVWSKLTGTANTNIGGKFEVTAGTNKYALQLKDGTETAGGGKFLKDTGDGKAQWADVPSGATSIGELSDAATPATDNVGLGSGALSSITTGGYNVAVGVNAGLGAAGASRCVFIGNDAGRNVSSRSDCVAVGEGAMGVGTGGNTNIAVGANALSGVTGQGNVGIGNSAGSSITSGGFSLFLGRNANGLNTQSYQIAIGTSVTTTQGYSLALGSSGKLLLHGDFATAGRTKLGVNLGNTYSAPTANLHVKGNASDTTTFLVQNGAGSSILQANQNGNIGIGTTAPDSILNVEGAKGKLKLRLDDENGVSNAVNQLFLTSEEATYTNYVSVGTTQASAELQLGMIGPSSTSAKVGSTNDSFIVATSAADNMNFINNAGSGTTDNIGFYAGKPVNDTLVSTTPDLIILGDGANIGNVGIGTATPTEKLEINGNVKVGGQAYSATHTLTAAASVAPDFDNSNVQTVTLDQATTLANPTNLKDGATYIFIVKQPAGANHTLAFGTAYKFEGGTAPTITAANGATDLLTFVSDGTNLYGAAALNFS